MRLLLDTNALLWVALDPSKLSERAVEAYREAESVYHSIVSYWEIGLKMARGGFMDLSLPRDWERSLSQGYEEQGVSLLAIDFKHCRRIQDLPFHHKDPFDRMLTAQALEEHLAVISPDHALDAYGVKRIW